MVNKVPYRDTGNALLVTSRNPKNRDKGIALFLGLSSDTIKM